MQKGQSEFYRGVPMDVTLLPKVKVEVVVSRVPVRSVIDVTKRVDVYKRQVYVAKAVSMMQPRRIVITYGTNNTHSTADTFNNQYRSALELSLIHI